MHALASHLSAVVLTMAALAVTPGTPGPQQPVSAEGTAQFAVLLRGVRIGSEQVDVTRPGGGLKISARGQLAAPFDLVTHKFEMTYGSDWQPQLLSVEGVHGGQSIALSTSFGVTTAINEMSQGPKRGSVTHQVSPRAVVLPNNFFAAYEILAARLGSLATGTRLPVYVAPEGEISATLDRVSDRRVAGPSGAAEFKQYDLTFAQARGSSTVQIWVDARNRLARVALPAAEVMVIRDDLASVMVREEKIRNPGDEDVFIPASGFNLAATITRPAGAAGRSAAVILIGGSGRQDRDEVLYGVPIFGQIAGALADAGYVVVRFDKRGVGQSGGRTEHASLAEYAQDVAAIVDWLRRRKDVDADRIAVAGYTEGGAVALVAAGREKRIKAVALLAAPGSTGRDVTLEQQQRVLARLGESQADRQAKIELQRRVIEAAITGKGWETIPPDVRKQADTPWFRSWLTFDPAAAIRKIDKPLLILHGALDVEMSPVNAQRLEGLSAGRKNATPALTTKVIVADANHLLATARTGDVDEYELLDKKVSPAVTSAIVTWLAAALPERRR